MPSELDELVEFLSSPRDEVRKMAVEIVRDLTGSDAGIRQLAAKSADLVPPLLKLLHDKPVGACHLALPPLTPYQFLP
eukprot:jgi/Mesen1/4524/ME000230S03667